MEHFRPDGHLTKEAIAALAAGQELNELTRLELAEHLAYCDRCLQRYTDALEGAAVLTPEHSCRESLWQRVRMRTLRLITSRYAAAAAAVVLALSVVWGGNPARFEMREQRAGAVTQRIEHWNRAMDDAVSGLGEFLDGLSALTGR